ncbi:MAG: gliding motility-associated C-terminal domain-containing protein, partial [candidate division KSB1 bacterium]|nr:gliding motility-associated C-terminal domain-containing protein [candidate division KSB1 bacterium]
LPDLIIKSFDTSTGNKQFAKDETVELNAVIVSLYADCKDTFVVNFYLDETVILKTDTINGLPKDTPYLLRLQNFKMPDSNNHSISIEVDVSNAIKEQSESNNKSTIEIYPPSILTVTPNPFTPNDDGKNDEAVFNFETFQIGGANLKIFDIHGRKIYEQDWASSTKRIRWNGRDSSGRPVLPGVYLYIFSDRNKPLARGCVVVAK